VQELYLEIGKVTETLSQELGRSPMVSELASATGTTEEAVLEALEAGQGYRTASIDATDRNEEVIASRIGEDDTSLGTVEDRELLAPALATLAPRERLILQLRFANGLTQSEIAARVGISQMHVSRLLAASLERLRKTVTGAGAGAGKARGPDGRDATTSIRPGEDGGREGRDAS
jgi:RNA polymerase sigma-B factor